MNLDCSGEPFRGSALSPGAHVFTYFFQSISGSFFSGFFSIFNIFPESDRNFPALTMPKPCVLQALPLIRASFHFLENGRNFPEIPTAKLMNSRRFSLFLADFGTPLGSILVASGTMFAPFWNILVQILIKNHIFRHPSQQITSRQSQTPPPKELHRPWARSGTLPTAT